MFKVTAYNGTTKEIYYAKNVQEAIQMFITFTGLHMTDIKSVVHESDCRKEKES